MSRFETSLEHLMAELELVDLRLRLQIIRNRQRDNQQDKDEFRGLYISEEDIDAILAGSSNIKSNSESQDDNSSLAASIRQLQDEILIRKSQSLADGVELRLCNLASKFGLSQFDIDTLLICLLLEVDTKYEKLYAYLHDDVTRKRPTVNLILQCLLSRLEDRVKSRQAFLPHAPLIANHLVRMEDDPAARAPSFLSSNLKIEDRIANYLLESDQVDPRIARYSRRILPTIKLGDLVVHEALSQQLSRLDLLSGSDLNKSVVYVQGPYGIGKRSTAEALCHSWGVPLLMVDVGGLLADELPPELGITLVFREAKLQGTAICWDRIDLLLSEEKGIKYYLGRMIQGINAFSGLVIGAGETAWQPGDALSGKSFVRIELGLPSYAARRQLWKIHLNGHQTDIPEKDIAEIADKFRFTPRQIKDAAATAYNLSISNGEEHISDSDLYSACRVMSNHKLNLLARKIEPKYDWKDIILPKDQLMQLHEIANYVKNRHIVFTNWNFERKISLGKGLNVLFAGPSGTGKTMSAEIIANELGLDLYKIDLSTVVSKYIGETEKNLDKIFTEAQNSNSILFFDEADAVFGKRSEVRDSHDRYANIETAYLLQKMEEYDGIVILATNLRKNIDEAFARRMHFSIEYPQPEETDRLMIWKGVFPKEAPVSADVDIRFMARQFKITGGNIKNIALASAFLAAGNGATIKMEHLIRSTKREFQKIGRLCTEADFGAYFDLVKG